VSQSGKVRPELRAAALVLPLLLSGCSDTVQLAAISAFVTIGSIIAAGFVQKYLTNEQTDTLTAGQKDIHDLVDGAASELKTTAADHVKEITALKDEISRLSQPGAHPTPQGKAGEGAPLQVTQDHGVITTQPDAKTGRRASDTAEAPTSPEDLEEPEPV
jgi:hypothetical protein